MHGVYSVPAVASLLGLPFFGSSGVDVFFVISGFIMVAITARGEAASPGRFLLQRIVRVVPLYWLALLLTVVGGSFTAAEIAKSFLFIPYASQRLYGGLYPILPSGWTLNYEMFFYLLFALSLAGPRRLRVPALAALMALWVLAGKFLGPFSGAWANFYSSPLLLEFAGGMLLARVWMTHGAPRSLGIALAAIVLGLYSLGAAHSRPVIMGGAFLIVAAALHPWLAALRSRALLALGNASYSIYLFHPIVQDALAWASTRFVWRVSRATSYVYLIGAVALSLACGLICYRYVEQPLITRLRRLARTL